MTLHAFITLRLAGAAAVLLFAAASLSAAPKVAVLSPDGTDASERFAAAIAESFGNAVSVIDPDLAASAYRSQSLSAPFNMTADESKRLGAAIGCDLFLVTKAVVQRRSSSQRRDHFEAFGVIYLVSSRTGHLVYWDLKSLEAAKAEDAEEQLISSAVELAKLVERSAADSVRAELQTPRPPEMEEPPEPASPPAKNFKAPVPYRRIKPQYTAKAAFYETAATVEIVVDLDAQGQIMRTEITRWAGFGLDEAVDAAVRSMNWRPAERAGKFLPMRFLLRYNFKKIEKDQ